MVVHVFVVYHEQAGCIPGGRHGAQLARCYGVYPVLQVVGAQVAVVEAEVDHFGQLVEREEIIGLFIDGLLEVHDAGAPEVYSGAFAEEDVASPVEDEEVAHIVLSEAGEQETFDPVLNRSHLLEGKFQGALIEFVFFEIGACLACFHVDDFPHALDGVSQFIGFGINGYVIDIEAIAPGFDKDFTAFHFKSQYRSFCNDEVIGITSVDVAVFKL